MRGAWRALISFLGSNFNRVSLFGAATPISGKKGSGCRALSIDLLPLLVMINLLGFPSPQRIETPARLLYTHKE